MTHGSQWSSQSSVVEDTCILQSAILHSLTQSQEHKAQFMQYIDSCQKLPSRVNGRWGLCLLREGWIQKLPLDLSSRIEAASCHVIGHHTNTVQSTVNNKLPKLCFCNVGKPAAASYGRSWANLSCSSTIFGEFFCDFFFDVAINFYLSLESSSVS